MAAAAVARKAREAAAEPDPWYMQLIHHILTPGSSLTSGIWTLFNVLIGLLALVWIMFAVNFPTSVHVWVFLGLLVGLALSTNWFMKEIFAAKEDFHSQQARKELEEKNKKRDAVEAVEVKKTK